MALAGGGQTEYRVGGTPEFKGELDIWALEELLVGSVRDPRKDRRPRASHYGVDPQRPVRRNSGSGRSCGGAAVWRTRSWQSLKRCLAQSIPRSQRPSTCSPMSCGPRVTLWKPDSSSSARWQSAKKRLAPRIPTRRRASPRSHSYVNIRAIL
jgi:hypothetical protein